MDGVREFLEALRHHNLTAGRFRAILHVVIGRKVMRADGSTVCNGITWRELSNLLKLIRWDKDAVRELGIDPDTLPPRDRQRYWYVAITQAKVDSLEAWQAAEDLTRMVEPMGYHIQPRPRT